MLGLHWMKMTYLLIAVSWKQVVIMQYTISLGLGGTHCWRWHIWTLLLFSKKQLVYSALDHVANEAGPVRNCNTLDCLAKEASPWLKMTYVHISDTYQMEEFRLPRLRGALTCLMTYDRFGVVLLDYRSIVMEIYWLQSYAFCEQITDLSCQTNEGL